MTSRIEREKTTVKCMIALYCRKKERNATLCDDCRRLTEYALARLDACRCGENKPACKKCPHHCYSGHYRVKIREVMRFSGPRMMLYHPLAVLRHFLKR